MDIKIKHFNKDYESTLVLGLIIGIFLLPVINNFLFGSMLLFSNLILIFGMPLFCMSVYFFCELAFKENKEFIQFVKFALIGVANTAVNIGVFNYFVNATGLTSGVPIIVISSVSFLASAINSYIWNTHWSFNQNFNNSLRPFESFFIITFLGLLINDTAIIIVSSIFSASASAKVLVNVANLCGIIFAMFWNFFNYKFLVFKKGK
ncbi:MAG: hypothetical protein NVSMB66_3760 [Candidatus Doudnabacteria bacterium]